MVTRDLFTQVKQQKIYSQIIDQITALIERGDFLPGTQLPPERTLTQQLGVSRASLREALTAMQMMGMVKTVSGQGTFIIGLQKANPQNLSQSDLGESPFMIMQARKTLEPSIAALAASVRTDSSLRRIGEILDWVESDQSQAQVGGDTFSEGDRTFHLEIARATENGLIISVQERFYALVGQALWLTFMRSTSMATPNRWQESVKEHRSIYEAIRDGNQGEAAKRVRAHLTRVETIMEQADLVSNKKDKPT
jgi:GntR family transcriptional repressor for pyruvate dehydrogenase complex